VLVHLKRAVHLSLYRRATGLEPDAVGGPTQVGQAIPKALPRTAVEALLETVAQDQNSKRQIDWAERDPAIIPTALLAGLRVDELRQADVDDIRTTDDGAAVIHVKGKGGKGRSVPIEANYSRSSQFHQ
jgi:integrase/recombinase XerC